MNAPRFKDEVRKRSGCTADQVVRVLNAMRDVLIEELTAGGEVKLPGIGRFTVTRKGPWSARDPVTGERIEVPPKWFPKFNPIHGLALLVANSPKLEQEVDLLERYGLTKEEGNGKVRSGDRPQARREGKARKRFPWD